LVNLMGINFDYTSWTIGPFSPYCYDSLFLVKLQI
jgi:hypothetical protein